MNKLEKAVRTSQYIGLGCQGIVEASHFGNVGRIADWATISFRTNGQNFIATPKSTAFWGFLGIMYRVS
jgi:hypothetical protein